MPRRKIRLEDITVQDAFARLEMENLDIQVKGIRQGLPPPVPLDTIMELPASPYAEPARSRREKKTMKVTLFCRHYVGCGGKLVNEGLPTQHVEGNTHMEFGPGIVDVPLELAAELMSQDQRARIADERAYDGKFRSFIVTPTRVGGKMVYAGVCVSENGPFDLSGALGRIGDGITGRIQDGGLQFA